MTSGNRESCIQVTLGYEGGYTNHPSDPGGPTNWGITIFDSRKYWKIDATADDVRHMPIGVAVEIYRQRYWAPQRCDDLPPGVDLAVFDYGVNSGIGRSAKVLQRIVGVPEDGKVGDATVAAARMKNAAATCKAICAERLGFLRGLRTWSVFGKGWGARVANVEARSVKMAFAASPLYSASDVTKKLNTESKAASTQARTEVTKVGATVGAPISTQIPNAPHHVDVNTFPHWLLWLSVVIACAAVAVFIYRCWIHRQRAAAYLAVAAEQG